MKKEFRPIAMKCNREQFDIIKYKLEGKTEFYSVSEEEFERYNYLVNCDFGGLSNVHKLGFKHIWRQDPEIHETWNEKIFLEACGIETIPTLEEVKEYFKDAEKVQCIFDKGLISEIDVNKIKFKYGEYWCEIIDSEINLWDTTKGYAKILTYKEKTFSITESQLKLIHGLSTDQVQDNITDWFPEAFEPEKKELVAGKWYKMPEHKKFLGVVTKIESDRFWYYGFNTGGIYRESDFYGIDEILIEATKEEVEEALKAEAVRRGLVPGSMVERPNYFINKGVVKIDKEESHTGLFGFDNDQFEVNGSCVFEKGKWASLFIKKMTQAEIEKELGYLIEIVS